MSRLDDEYDPAEHHDLDRIEIDEPRRATGDHWYAVAYCACGWFSDWCLGEAGARIVHVEHRDWVLP